jgi:hypothetical protein
MIVVWVVAGLIAAASAIAGAARLRMQRQTDREIDRLLANATHAGGTVTEADLADLPDPVVRWMRWSGAVGGKRADVVRLKQEGHFHMEGRGWFPFEADQYFTTMPPAFLWRVNLQMFPLASVHGRDRYADGTGSMQMKILSLVPAVDKTGGGLDQGALLRYLGETIWFPSGTLGPYIEWDAIDSDSAKATMGYGGTVASAVFFIDAEGRPTGIKADRYNDSRGRNLPWIAESTRYGEFGGNRMPVAGTGSWQLDGGTFTYIEWRVTDVEANVAERY